MRLFILFIAAAVALATERQAALKPSYSNVPNPDWSRKPHPAKDAGHEQIIPVIYSAVSHDEAKEADETNPTHVRAGDNKVIISEDPQSSYNSTGEYQAGVKDGEEASCTICPRSDDCESSSCYSKCFKFRGPQCAIAKAEGECTIGKDCGFTSSSQAVRGSQDMVKGYEKMKAPAGRSPGTPDKPLAEHARYPHPARPEDEKDYDATAIEGEVTESPMGTGPVGETGPEGETTAAEDEGTGPEKEVVSVQNVAVKTIKNNLR